MELHAACGTALRRCEPKVIEYLQQKSLYRTRKSFFKDLRASLSDTP